MKWLKRVWEFLAGIPHRPGLPEFLKEWVPVVVTIIQEELAKARQTDPNATLATVIAPVTKRVTERTKTPFDNWAVMVIAAAYEWMKANRKV